MIDNMQIAKSIDAQMGLSDALLVREVRISDLPSIVKCHKTVFPDALSTAMGSNYVRKMLEWYIAAPQSFLFFIENKGECIGYCGGMVREPHSEGSASSMVQYSFWAAVGALLSQPALLLHPEVRTKYSFILKNVKNRILRKVVPTRQGPEPSPEKDLVPISPVDPYAGLVVIGVQPLWQSKGYGTLLMDQFDSVVRQRGVRRAVLSVRSGNTKAIRSYVQNRWTVKTIYDSHTVMEKLYS